MRGWERENVKPGVSETKSRERNKSKQFKMKHDDDVNCIVCGELFSESRSEEKRGLCVTCAQVGLTFCVRPWWQNIRVRRLYPWFVPLVSSIVPLVRLRRPGGTRHGKRVPCRTVSRNFWNVHEHVILWPIILILAYVVTETWCPNKKFKLRFWPFRCTCYLHISLSGTTTATLPYTC